MSTRSQLSSSLPRLLAVALALAAAAGCAAAPRIPGAEPIAGAGDGPKITPDARQWRRQPVPLPPFYMDIRTGSGERWQMVTPLAWRIEGRGKRQDCLVPLASHSVDETTGSSAGHVLTWIWKRSPESEWQTLAPLYWSRSTERATTSIWGPLWTRREHGDDHRSRLVVFPWLFSRETDDTGYDYWSVGARLFGFEKQLIDGIERKRIWLLFFVRIPV